MKPLDFSVILKLSKSQLSENGFKDATIEEIYSGLLSYLAVNSCRIGFPELVTPLIFQLKDFLKKSKVGNYCKKMKQILDENRSISGLERSRQLKSGKPRWSETEPRSSPSINPGRRLPTPRR